MGAPWAAKASAAAAPESRDPEECSMSDGCSQGADDLDLSDDDSGAVVATIESSRWECDLCRGQYCATTAPWDFNVASCEHRFCRQCIVGLIGWGGRCPYDGTTIPPIVMCGALNTREYIDREKQEGAKSLGGIMCSSEDCPGVVPPLGDGLPAMPVACGRCKKLHCGRRICGASWARGHLCWDSRATEDKARRRTAEMVQEIKFGSCPSCGTMVEHDGGCNMMFHESCGTSWCFVCRRVGTCDHFLCRAPDARVAEEARGPEPQKEAVGTRVGGVKSDAKPEVVEEEDAM